jgi:hypothetical protein
MSDYQPIKLFTLSAANRSLPLVRAIAHDMSELARGIAERRQRIRFLGLARRDGRTDPYIEELAEIEEQLDDEERRLDDFARELAELGIEPKNAVEGLVDFPAEREGRIVYLCWKLDEPKVQFWHELDTGFAGRQRIREAEWIAALERAATFEQG